MKQCIICKAETKHPSYDFCEACFNLSIDELDRKYGKGKGPLEPGKDTKEAPVSKPLTENTHH